MADKNININLNFFDKDMKYSQKGNVKWDELFGMLFGVNSQGNDWDTLFKMFFGTDFDDNDDNDIKSDKKYDYQYVESMHEDKKLSNLLNSILMYIKTLETEEEMFQEIKNVLRICKQDKFTDRLNDDKIDLKFVKSIKQCGFWIRLDPKDSISEIYTELQNKYVNKLKDVVE